jgi:hypothetical protein
VGSEEAPTTANLDEVKKVFRDSDMALDDMRLDLRIRFWIWVWGSYHGLGGVFGKWLNADQ